MKTLLAATLLAGVLSPVAALLRQAFVHRAGHCQFTTGEMLAAFEAIEHRATTGQWPATGPNALNAAATRLDPNATPAYLTYRPAPYPRPFDLAHQ